MSDELDDILKCAARENLRGMGISERSIPPTSNPKITYSEASDRFYYDWNGVIRPATEREIAGAMERLAAFEHEHDALLRGRIPTHRCKICGALWILWPAGTAGMAEASWSLFSLRCGQCCDCAPMLEQIEPLPRLGGSAPETSERCHFRAFGQLPCEKPKGHDGDHTCQLPADHRSGTEPLSRVIADLEMAISPDLARSVADRFELVEKALRQLKSAEKASAN